MSDQPASCPLCGAILRQSRNLRRHLELLHFGLGNSNSGMHARYRRAGRNNDLHRASLESVRLSQTARMDHGRLSESSDFPTMTPLSTASSTSNVSHSGNLSGSSTSAVVTSEQSGHPVTDVASTSCTASMAPPSNSMYSTDSVLSCLLPSLPSLPPFSTSHDVFRHGEILRAGIAYHDSTRQHSRHMQRTDVT
ncbi:hypothetical protein KM043_014202 [Ampulex compressa]|nr:hypothetical protein KM043_014202 [Ampulex compressa]